MRSWLSVTLCCAVLVGGCQSTTGSTSDQTGESGLPTVSASELPDEARQTLVLIAQGGPFRFSSDGATFFNREGLLPPRPAGYYTEYTVVTPGEFDRGARRIVAGDGGDHYYTADHYASFREVTTP